MPHMELLHVPEIPRPVLPDPELAPTIPLWPDAGRALRLGRSSTYDAAARGQIPGAVQIGGQWRVATATFRRALGLDRAEGDAA